MNVLFMTTHLNAGGITTYVLTLAKQFRRAGHKVYVVSSGGGLDDEFLRIGVELLTFNIRTKSEVDPKIYLPLFKLARFIKDHDIDIIHSQTRITQVMGKILGLWTRTPYVSTCHGFYKPRWFRKVFSCWGDVVIAISPAVQQHLEQDFAVDPKNVFFVAHGIEVDQFKVIPEFEKQEQRKKRGVLGGPVIGIIARLADVKGHDVLIRAMPRIREQFSEVQLVIVGEGKMDKALHELVKELQLEKIVLFFPVVNCSPDFLPLFDVSVLPSLDEGLGLSVMEAQAAGLPVVASRVGGLVSLIDSGKTGILVEPKDSQGLAEAIIAVLRDPAHAKAMGIAAREFIQQRHSSVRMATDTLEVYREVRNIQGSKNG